jgi:hypothetical protein
MSHRFSSSLECGAPTEVNSLFWPHMQLYILAVFLPPDCIEVDFVGRENFWTVPTYR